MTRQIATVAAILVAGAFGAMAAEPVPPGSVTYDDGAVAQSLTGVPGDPVAGREVMGDRGLGNCVACHEVGALKDVPWHGEVGPTLDGAGERWTPEELRGIVANAKMTFEDTIMPSFYKNSGYIRPGDEFTGNAATELSPLLTAQQVEDVVAFLLTLKE